ncbi:MAG TPA: YceI family protein [Chloroflexia bacterium]|jgi:polyisoprenoid-binding protein YceI
MKRLLLVVGVALALVAVIALVYLLRLTAPVEVSNTPPLAATLVVPTRTVVAGETEPAPTRNAAQAAATPTGTTVQAVATSPTSPTPPAAARVYRIDPDLSQASYRVGETFFDQRGFVIAVGTTNAVAGDILVDPANLPASQVGEIVVDISQLRTDEPMRDSAIRRRWLESATYPLARFNNAKIIDIPATATEGQPFKFQISGDMTVREVTKPVTWEAETTLDGYTLRGTATTKLKMSDFGIEPPSLMSLQVEDDVELTLEFVANAVQE